MSEIPDAQKATEVLSLLTALRHTPQQIEDGYNNESFTPHDLVMTSMGNRRRAVVTPMYPAFQYEYYLGHRLQRASEYRRPLVEASVELQPRNIAALTLRLCMLPMTDTVRAIRSSWAYDLGSDGESVNTFEDVVDAIHQNAAQSEAHPQSTGYVVLSFERKMNNNWGISDLVYPTDMINILHEVVSNELAFVRP